MITTLKIVIVAAYLMFWTNLYRNDSFVSAAIKTINAIAHAIAIVGISLLLKNASH